jgi:hypothetical protein
MCLNVIATNLVEFKLGYDHASLDTAVASIISSTKQRNTKKNNKNKKKTKYNKPLLPLCAFPFEVLLGFFDLSELVVETEDQIFDMISEVNSNIVRDSAWRKKEIASEDLVALWKRCRFAWLSPQYLGKVHAADGEIPRDNVSLGVNAALVRARDGESALRGFIQKCGATPEEIARLYPRSCVAANKREEEKRMKKKIKEEKERLNTLAVAVTRLTTEKTQLAQQLHFWSHSVAVTRLTAEKSQLAQQLKRYRGW